MSGRKKDQKATLFVFEEKDASRQWQFPAPSTIHIGRAPENDICLRHREVSRLHGVVFHLEDSWKCASVGRNGIYVDGQRVSFVPIREGLVVRFGPSGPKLQFQPEVPVTQPSQFADDEPVSEWLNEIKFGRDSSENLLWQLCFDQVVRLARHRLGARSRRVADEEDVASSVLKILIMGIREGRFSKLSDRQELWQLLVVITTRKVRDQVKYLHRQKRGGGLVRGDSAVMMPGDWNLIGADFDLLEGNEPTPEFIVAMAEEIEKMLSALNDEELKAIALWKLEAYSNVEIAQKLTCSVRTVERRLQAIRECWSTSTNKE